MKYLKYKKRQFILSPAQIKYSAFQQVKENNQPNTYNFITFWKFKILFISYRICFLFQDFNKYEYGLIKLFYLKTTKSKNHKLKISMKAILHFIQDMFIVGSQFAHGVKLANPGLNNLAVLLINHRRWHGISLFGLTHRG